MNKEIQNGGQESKESKGMKKNEISWKRRHERKRYGKRVKNMNKRMTVRREFKKEIG